MPQIPNIRRMLAALGIPVLECEGFEADDVLATVARLVEQAGGNCVLVTGDKDCRQLISDRVGVFNIRKNLVFDAAALLEEWGIAPEQVVDFQTLVGDSVDNIPGVPLVGPKVAKEWLGKFGTLDNLLDHVDELPKGKRKENLLAAHEISCPSLVGWCGCIRKCRFRSIGTRRMPGDSIPPAPPNCFPSLDFTRSPIKCAIGPNPMRRRLRTAMKRLPRLSGCNGW